MNQNVELVLNSSEFDSYIETFLIKHNNDILDTLLNNYLLKHKLVYKTFLNNLLNNDLVSTNLNEEDNEEDLDLNFNVQCSNCKYLKFTNLADFKQHQIDKHFIDRTQLNLILIKNCLTHFTSRQDELRHYIKSKAQTLTDPTTIDLIASNLLLNRMNKTFALNSSTKPAVNKLPFSAESLLSNQPKQSPQMPTTNTEQYASLLNYFKTAQMPNPQQNPLLNQLFLPLMLSSTPMAAVAAAAAVSSPNPTPASPIPPEDSVKSENLDESLDMNPNNSSNRRRRTRITEDQLKVLRQYFDINKSPPDEQIIDIARQTQLPAKVIKHWFRNTLFKERQKDKDSPYNFNNPPLTQLNLEEYEKTGKVVSEPASTQLKLDDSVKQENLLNESSFSDENQNLNVDESDEQNIVDINSSSRCSSVGLKNRPNRTKFNESQIKALNVAFRQQKYPKDEQISQLAKQLSLKPRVITVWFQNARQKARKTTVNSKEDVTSHVDDLDEYYDLNDDCDDTQSQVSSSTDKSSKSQNGDSNMLALAAAQAAANAKALQLQLAMSLLAAHQQQQQQQQMQQNEKTSSSSSSASSTDSKKNDDDEDELDDEDDEEDLNEDDETDSSKNIQKLDQSKSLPNSTNNKRLRTTILPEQQEFLMQKYQLDQNPSRKMLDEIAKQVRLKKRVVQVWFQNTRARERKGIIKINPTQTFSNNNNTSTTMTKMFKKCALCSQNFRSKSELESHLILKHNYTSEQASAVDGDDEPKVAQSQRAKSPVQYAQNGLNSMLMSTLLAHFQQQQQQQQQQQPFDLSFNKVKNEPLAHSPIIKPISQNTENRSRSSSGSGTPTLSKVKPVNLVKKEVMSNLSLSNSQNQRRVRTQMTQYQVNVMRLIFAEYKTPTMNECETMGKEINLKKRVVQVWFQNARAKEKKNNSNGNRSILFSNTANNDLSNFEFSPDECLLCSVKYNCSSMNNNNGSISQQQREHLFSKQHLNKLIQFVTKIAVENGANPVEFKNGHDEDESDVDDECNSDEDDEDQNQENESQEEIKEENSKQNNSFDMNRLLQLPQQQQQQQPNANLYNYFMYPNMFNQTKIMPNSSSASSTSSTCSNNSSTPSSATTSPFYNQFSNPMLAQIYAALAVQQQQQQQNHMFPLDNLNLPKNVQFDIEKKLAGTSTSTIQYSLDGTSKADLVSKFGMNSQDVDEHVQASYFICRSCRCVSANRDLLLTHQCLNQIVNMKSTNLLKLEQIGYKCLICANQDVVFTSASDLVEHATLLGHFMIKKTTTNTTTTNGLKRSEDLDLDSNNNSKKIKY